MTTRINFGLKAIPNFALLAVLAMFAISAFGAYRELQQAYSSWPYGFQTMHHDLAFILPLAVAGIAFNSAKLFAHENLLTLGIQARSRFSILARSVCTWAISCFIAYVLPAALIYVLRPGSFSVNVTLLAELPIFCWLLCLSSFGAVLALLLKKLSPVQVAALGAIITFGGVYPVQLDFRLAPLTPMWQNWIRQLADPLLVLWLCSVPLLICLGFLVLASEIAKVPQHLNFGKLGASGLICCLAIALGLIAPLKQATLEPVECSPIPGSSAHTCLALRDTTARPVIEKQVTQFFESTGIRDDRVIAIGASFVPPEYLPANTPTFGLTTDRSRINVASGLANIYSGVFNCVGATEESAMVTIRLMDWLNARANAIQETPKNTSAQNLAGIQGEGKGSDLYPALDQFTDESIIALINDRKELIDTCTANFAVLEPKAN